MRTFLKSLGIAVIASVAAVGVANAGTISADQGAAQVNRAQTFTPSYGSLHPFTPSFGALHPFTPSFGALHPFAD